MVTSLKVQKISDKNLVDTTSCCEMRWSRICTCFEMSTPIYAARGRPPGPPVTATGICKNYLLTTEEAGTAARVTAHGEGEER